MLIEVLVALSVLVLVLGVLVVVSSGNNSLSTDARASDEALYRAKKNLEAAGALAKDNWNGLVSSSTVQSPFTEELVVEAVDGFTKKVTSRVRWGEGTARPQKIELLAYVTDLSTALNGGLAGGGGGGSAPAGDWRNPQTLATLDLGPGNAGTDIVVRNKIIYMTAIASAASKPDFFVIDAATGTAPVLKSSINTGKGLNALKISGPYAYAAQDDALAQLQIISVSDPANPSVLGSYPLPGVSGSNSVGRSIFVAQSTAYVGVPKNTGVEFKIVDVADPANPVDRGGFEVNGDVNGIYVKGGTAYLATSRDDAEVIVLDIANPGSVVEIGSFNASGTADAYAVFPTAAAPKRLYAGRDDGAESQLVILDIENPGIITQIGGAPTGNRVNDLVVGGDVAFLGTANSNQEFQAWNVSSPAAPSFWSSFNFPQNGTGIDYENNLVYMSVRSNDALRIITSAP